VSFNGTDAPGFKVTGNTKITVRRARGASGPIVVTNASGDSDPSDDFNVVTAVPAPASTTCRTVASAPRSSSRVPTSMTPRP
jgi:hypothetical protein